MDAIGCVLLGAGLSTRMGMPKLLQTVGGRTIFEISLENHLGSRLTAISAVVAGWLPAFHRISGRYAEDRVTFVELDRPCEMSHSLKEGWSRLQQDSKPDAVMISLADQPLVRPPTINLLMACYTASDCPICVPVYREQWGHPVIISSDLTREIMQIGGDEGARAILKGRRDQVHEVDVSTDEVLLDLDRAQDMDTVIARLMTGD